MARPDAHALKWGQLLRPSQEAVRDLIERLHSVAEEIRHQSDSLTSSAGQMPEIEVTSSFLLLGKRGSGKTTVLLSARQAIEAPGEFFSGKEVKTRANDEAQGKEQETDKGKNKDNEHIDLCRKADKLGNFVTWIDLIDLGPLPPTANIVVHILHRIREQLTSSGKHGKKVSLLASGEDDLLSQMDKLIQKASFLWGKEAPETDRKKSRQDQITEAEYYSNFRVELQNLMKKVALATRRPRAEVDSGGAILIAINNIDRRVEHLAELIRLIPLITGQHLWLILAASPMNLDVLLEKNIRDEFGNFGGELNKDLRSLGRRQQAAARRKAFPPGQEVEVRVCSASEALGFSISNHGDKNLRELLKEIPIAGSQSAPKEAESRKVEHFVDLFDLTSFFEKGILEWVYGVDLDTLEKLGGGKSSGANKKDEVSFVLSEAGLHALSLPLRNIVDLWMKLKRLSNKSHEAAIKVAFEVLADAVDESDLDPEIRERLISGLLMIDRHPDDLGSLDLTDSPLRRSFLRQPIYRFDLQGTPPSGFELEVELTRFIGCNIELLDKTSDKDGKRLATDVEGWLMLASDLVNLLSYTRSVNNEPQSWFINPRLVTTRLRGVCCNKRVDLDFHWPIPAWETYLDYEIFIRHWQAFFYWLGEVKKDIIQAAEEERLKWLRAAYLDCILSVSEDRGRWNWIERFTGRDVTAYEGLVVERLSALDQRPKSNELGGYDRTKAIVRWYREELPFFSCSFLGFKRLMTKEGDFYRTEYPSYAKTSWLSEVLEHCRNFKGKGSANCTADDLFDMLTASGGEHDPG